LLVSRRLFNTISFRLAALCALLFALILAVLLVFNYLATNHALEDQLRSRVMENFNTFAEEVGGESGDELVKEFDERLTRSPAPGSFFYLADDRGDKLAGNLDHVPVVTGWQKLPATAAGRHEFEHTHEIWGAGKTLPNGLFIFVGQDAFRVIVAQNTLVMSYFWSGLIAGLAALAAGILLSRGFLHRIDAINQTSLAIMQGNLRKRIPTRGTSDEVDRLSGNLNRLFDNNQALLDSLRQVTVNIAHDLRTPLSRLRNRLEEARDASRIPLRLREQLDGAIAESDQLLATFSALLRIAQIESGSRKKAFAKVNLSELGERVFAIYQAVAEDEGKTLSADIAPEISCLGDGELLLQLCVNLVENAIRHTPKGTEITLRVSAPAKLEVADNGPGIPSGQREKVLERFYRLDQSRTTPGSGLGLALVAAIANLHNTRIELADHAPGLVARVRLHPN
jgi:signal transduction histidine kinase